MITVAICTHNGASRVTRVLDALARQQTPPCEWDVLVVDNASTDGTGAVAESHGSLGVPLRVVHEARPGLAFARLRAFAESSGGVVLVDDDNLLAPNYLARASELIDRHEKVGVFGGCGIPLFDDVAPPPWFQRYAQWYATGPQHCELGPPPVGWVYGAGAVFTRRAIDVLDNFAPTMTDRTGASSASGGDIEMCIEVRNHGLEVWFDPLLTFEHVIPAARLSWSYLLALAVASGVARDQIERLVGVSQPAKPRAIASALKQLTLAQWRLKQLPRNAEGDQRALDVAERIGRLRAALAR